MRAFHWVSNFFADGGILHHRHHNRTTRGHIVLEEMRCNHEAPLILGPQLLWQSWDVRYRSWSLPCLEGWYNIVGVLDPFSWPTKLRSHVVDHVLIKFRDVVVIMESFGGHLIYISNVNRHVGSTFKECSVLSISLNHSETRIKINKVE